jgi:hypothetical protein
MQSLLGKIINYYKQTDKQREMEKQQEILTIKNI